jgi:hypothetical protein
MNARNTWLLSQSEFTAVQPAISGVTASTAAPVINNNDTILATVTNASSTGVYLGYRYAVDKPFTRVLMYDDGAHGDGAAGDNVFGVSLPVNASFVQYYIYAENPNAGIFSPQRAEYEFYTLYATIAALSPGDVTINELLANNVSIVTDPAGEYEDYIELHNNTSAYVSMDNLYLSDSYVTPLKWTFPVNTVIAPDGYLIIWADNDTSQTGIHSNFKLSGSGEQVILSYASGTVIDSVSYGAQFANTSYARCANGTGPFAFLYPTYMSFNCVTGIDENNNTRDVSVYPNPSNGLVTIESMKPFRKTEVFDILGNLIYNETTETTQKMSLDLSQLQNGMYFIRIDGGNEKKITIAH